MKNHIEVLTVKVDQTQQLQYEVNALLRHGDRVVSVAFEGMVNDKKQFIVVVERNVGKVIITRSK